MLSFLNGAMTVSTQRYMSVNLGKNDINLLNKTYNASIVLHLIIGLAIVIGFELCGLFLFDGFLNIDPSRIGAAKIVYQILIVSTFLTIITVPYDAAINAHEDLIVFSLIGIGDALLKLGLAYCLFIVSSDRLVIYGVGVAIIAVLNVLVTRAYVIVKYKNLRFSLRRYFEWGYLKQMFSFAGWNTLGSMALIGRNQGLAIVVNKYFGTVINSAYGIANQMNSALASFSSVLQQSINPQLMKSEGMNNRDRMLKISYLSSKFTTMMLLVPAIPLVLEMPYVIDLWLKDIPPYTIEFGRWIIILAVITQLSVGVMSAVQAGGNIGGYQLAISVLLLLNIPLSIVLLSLGCPPFFVIIGCVCIEVIALFVRVLFAKKLVGFNISFFLTQVVLLILIPTFISALAGFVMILLLNQSFLRLVIVTIICVASFFISSWLFAFNVDERKIFISIFHNVLSKLRKSTI
jgi:Na+-driven multidrug efflux pump